MAFRSVKNLLAAAQERPLWLAVQQDDCRDRGASERESWERMSALWAAMVRSVEEYDGARRSASGLTGGAGALMENAGETLCGDFLQSVIATALKTGECNACMGRIVAAPTAGACGILPGALSSAAERFDVDDDELLDALFCSAGVGSVIAHRASISGAEGGCQAECGSAAAMAAAAMTQMKGGTPQQCANACAFALMNLMGLVCDPVQGLVEIPCVYRNVMGVAAAFTAADLALCEARLPLEPDDIIDAMGRVGRSLPRELRETGKGGCASCAVKCMD